MTKYEKSYEKAYPSENEDTLVSEEPNYKQIVTPVSEQILNDMLSLLKWLAEVWEGTICISYDETEPIRDYIITVTVNVIDLYNRRMSREFGDLMADAHFFMIRSYPKDRNEVQIIVIQSNAEYIDPDEDYKFD